VGGDFLQCVMLLMVPNNNNAGKSCDDVQRSGKLGTVLLALGEGVEDTFDTANELVCFVATTVGGGIRAGEALGICCCARYKSRLPRVAGIGVCYTCMDW
jgi:hypothetical protein